MKIKDLDALKENIRSMFKYKWQNSINKVVYEIIQEDVLNVIENHNGREHKK